MYEQEMKLAKVKKSCKTAKKVAKAFTIIMSIAAAICAVAGAGVYLNAAKLNPVLAQEADHMVFGNFETNGILALSVDMSHFLKAGLYAQGIATYCIFGLIVCLIVAFVFGTVTKTFAIIEESETPFSQHVLAKLKKVFITVTILTGLFFGLGSALIFALFFWCIYCIMDYGCVLQTEVDDTI